LATFPESALAGLNRALVVVFDAAMGPVSRLPAWAGVLVCSIVTAAAMLAVFARVSNQRRLHEAKRGIHAALFEIRLFNDDLGAVARALGELLLQNGRYVQASLVPLAWLALPLLLVTAQLQAFYGYAGLTPGAPALVTATIRDDAANAESVKRGLVLEASDGVRVDTGPVRLVGVNDVMWRIVPERAGDFTVTMRAGDVSVTKTVHASAGVARRSPLRVSGNLWDQLLYPSEPPIPSEAGLAALTVAYPEADIDVFGWHVHWVIVYALLSMACAFAMARRFGVSL
jgi:hypothetical protein